MRGSPSPAASWATRRDQSSVKGPAGRFTFDVACAPCARRDVVDRAEETVQLHTVRSLADVDDLLSRRVSLVVIDHDSEHVEVTRPRRRPHQSRLAPSIRLAQLVGSGYVVTSILTKPCGRAYRSLLRTLD